MKKNLRFVSVLFLLLLITLLFACTSEKVEYGDATKKLIDMVDRDSALKSMIISSLEIAKAINPDKSTNPAQSLEEYYEFLSYSETAMPWALHNKPEYTEFYESTFQSLCYFYFLIDQPIPELEGKELFNNSLAYGEPFASWVRTFSKSWGSYLDTEDSWNDEYYQIALNDPAFGLQNGWYEDPSNWKTFNQFFARYLSSPEMRPIASPDDNSIVVSYADAVPMGSWAIDSNSNIVPKEGVIVKSATVNSIEKLVGEDSGYKDAFVNGTFIHSFLNVNDYHRYHFSLGGLIKEARIIPGINPAGGEVSWDAENNRYAFDPSSVGWQSLETRGCVILETDDCGLVALLPIGMATVNSVNFEENIKPGVRVNKGDMLGYFLFGGSDFIMLFQEQVKFTIDLPMEEDGSYKHLLMGERLGYLTKNE